MHGHSINVALCAFAVAAATVASAPVLAKTATASATIDQFTYELIDLDPTDGITPGISFFDSEAHVSSRYWGAGVDEQSMLSTGTTQVVLSYGATSSTLSSTASSSKSSLVDPTAPYAVTHYFDSNSYYASNFILTAGTGLIVSAVGTVSVETQGPGSMGRASFGVSAILDNYPVSPSESIYSSHYYDTELGSASRRVSAFVFTNDVALKGSFSFSSSAATQLYTMPPPIPGPVPEPETYTMLLAGAAVIGLARRRQRRAGSAMA